MNYSCESILCKYYEVGGTKLIYYLQNLLILSNYLAAFLTLEKFPSTLKENCRELLGRLGTKQCRPEG